MFTSASASGLLKLLPVFLDHILHPVITPDTVDMEVFSLQRKADGTVGAQGVVYCEMKGRQHSEADLMDLWLRRGVSARESSTQPELSRFAFECGGLTQDIAGLSCEEIVAFHRQFYVPSGMTVLLSGRLGRQQTDEQQLLSAIDASLKAPEAYSNPEAQAAFVNPPADYRVPAQIPFPADDSSAGSVGLAWLGAEAGDLVTVLSYHVLFKYLREGSASPLHQCLVQVPEP